MPRARLTPCLLALAAALGPSCAEPEHPVRDCATVIWARQEAGGPLVVQGSWDGLTVPIPMTSWGEGWFFIELSLPPGEYGYRILEGGKARLDRYNPLTTFRVGPGGGDEEVSLAISPDCSTPEVLLDAVEVEGDTATVRASFFATPGGSPLDPDGINVSLWNGGSVALAGVDAERGAFTLNVSGLARGKHTFVVTASDTDGRASAPVRAVAWVEPASPSWEEGILYQIVTDRFRGDGGSPLATPATPGSRAGGTLDGIRAEIEKGTFEALGVSALWISPVYTNPAEYRVGSGGRLYEGYHQYWPAEPRGVEGRIGGEEALRALIDAAHRRGLKVLFDLVPNHVYESNERYLQHRDHGWFNNGPDACVCGTEDCGWGEHIRSCWFADYLPDVRWENPDVMRMGVEDALWWMDTFDADGVRIDAVPMMPRAATRRITGALRAHAAPRHALFSIGEVYTGPGAGAIESIRYFLGPHALDGAFDFPLMWAIRDAIATGRGGFDDVERILSRTSASLAGSGAVLGRMINNHDVARFISEATGGAGNDPWLAPPAQPDAADPYQRTRMALGLVLTLPGMPVLYYGDEVALAGAGDPDNRRVMPDLEAISEGQRSVLALARRLGPLRRCSAALRKGDRKLLAVADDIYAFRRDAGDGSPAVALFSTAGEPTEIPIPAGTVPAGAYLDAVSGEAVEIAPGMPVPMPPLSFRVLLPQESPCLADLGDLP